MQLNKGKDLKRERFTVMELQFLLQEEITATEGTSAGQAFGKEAVRGNSPPQELLQTSG